MAVNMSLVVPVMSNFKGFAELMASVKYPVLPIVINNWDENKGVAAAWNKGILKSIENWMDFTLIVNDDVILEHDTIINMLVRMDESLDLVTAVDTSKNDDSLDFSCFMIRPRSFMGKFGDFDENYYPAYFEDNDMEYRIKLGGGKAEKCLSAPMYHRGSQTQFAKGHEDDERVVSHEQFRRNQAYYIAKWGGEPGKEIYRIPFDGMTRKKDFTEW